MRMQPLRIKRRKTLERAYDKLPANDIRIIVGDTKIGKENLRNHA
jgi:hypothetical protein